jgi:hypothetical protein
MSLGDGIFLELIAPDPAVEPQRRRWFNLDDPAMRARLKNTPRIISWVIRVPDLRQALREVDTAAGDAVRVARGELSWLISVPPDGSMPLDGAYPTLIEWPPGPHPSSRMADLGCRLERFSVVHPEGAWLSRALDDVLVDDRLLVGTGGAFEIRATIRTPAGRRELT